MVWSAFYPHLHHSLSKRCSSHNGHILVSGSHPPHPHPRPIPTRNPSDSTNPPPQALAPSRKGSFFPIISPIQLPLTRIMGEYTPGQACLLESADSLFGDRAITAFFWATGKSFQLRRYEQTKLGVYRCARSEIPFLQSCNSQYMF